VPDITISKYTLVDEGVAVGVLASYASYASTDDLISASGR